MAYESKAKDVERSKKKGQGHGQALLPDEMEKHVLICRMKEKNNRNLLHACDVRSRRREISIDEQQQQKIHSQIKTLEKSQRLPFRDITNRLH